MKARELIKILEKHPEAEILTITGKEKRTHVIEWASTMAHTIFLVAEKTPYEFDNASAISD